MRGGIKLPDFPEHLVPRWAMGDTGDLGFQSSFLGCNSIFKGLGYGPATLHDNLRAYGS
jgi:hypothetical protein